MGTYKRGILKESQCMRIGLIQAHLPYTILVLYGGTNLLPGGVHDSIEKVYNKTLVLLRHATSFDPRLRPQDSLQVVSRHLYMLCCHNCCPCLGLLQIPGKGLDILPCPRLSTVLRSASLSLEVVRLGSPSGQRAVL